MPKYNSNMYDTDSEILLENKIFEEFCNYRLLKSEVAVIESNLDMFLMEYYQKIGEIIEKIEYIDSVLEKHEIDIYRIKGIVKKNAEIKNIFYSNKNHLNVKKNIDKKIKPTNDDSEEKFVNSQMNDEDDDDAFKREINRIYRVVVKYCHPDAHDADPDSKEAFSMLHNAYKNKDLKTLLTLEKIFIDDKTLDNASLDNISGDNISKNKRDKELRLEILKKQYLKLQNDNKSLIKKKESLRNSDVFLLQRRIRWANMCGTDMLQEIKDSAAKELHKKINSIKKMGIDIEKIEEERVIVI